MFGNAAQLGSERTPFRPQPSRPATPTGRRADVVALPVRGTAGQPAGAGQWAGGAGEHPAGADHRPVELHLLGGFRLLVGGELIDVGRTGARVLAAVACRGRQASRSQVAHALWPDTTSERAHANLRTALYRLCRRAPESVHVTATYIQLTIGMHIDFEQSSRLANRILGGVDVLLSDAMQVNLHDDLLPDWDDEWLADHQYRYRQLRITALETLSGQLGSAGRHGAAVQVALAAVQADTLRDSAHETLIRACLAQGNRHEAYTHYTTYRRMLRDELGLEPPAEIGRLLTSA